MESGSMMEAAAARLGVQLIKQYPAKEQAELKVKVQLLWVRIKQVSFSRPPSK